MAQIFYYKKNDDSRLYRGIIAYIPDVSSLQYADGILDNNPSFYYNYGGVSATGSGFGTSAVNASRRLYNEGTNSFKATLLSLWKDATAGATHFSIDGSTYKICSSDGTELVSIYTSNPLSSTDYRAKVSIGNLHDFTMPMLATPTSSVSASFVINSDLINYGLSFSMSCATGSPVSYDIYANQFVPSIQDFTSIMTNVVEFKEPSGSDYGDSSFSGGFGEYNFGSTDINTDDLDISASGASPAIKAGLVNPYYVTASEISALGNFLWSSNFFDSIAKTFSNPMDCIISLSSFPVSSSSMSLGTSESVRVGNTTSSSTGTRLISEFVTIDCGSVSVPEVWGSYLDYAQTKLYIYIPYLGIEELPLCECMGGSIACTLRINLLTGALVACLTLTSGTYVTGSARVQPIYFSTTCKSDIPVSGATTGALAGAFQLLGGAVSTVAGVASGTAPVAVAGLASAAQGVATMQSQNSQISGAVGAAGGQMAHKTPFLIFDRPVQSVPANLASVAGYQSNSGTTLSRCSGYVICDTINLDGLALTRSELEEVEQICTSGVYIS